MSDYEILVRIKNLTDSEAVAVGGEILNEHGEDLDAAAGEFTLVVSRSDDEVEMLAYSSGMELNVEPGVQ